MFFAGLTSAYIVRKAEGNWLEFQLPDWFLLTTIVIVISSIYLIIASRKINQNKDATIWLFVALLLGCVFAFSQEALHSTEIDRPAISGAAGPRALLLGG